ncbi:MAG: nucleoside-diphosphate kinase, partial [Pseudomonadota bacterium]
MPSEVFVVIKPDAVARGVFKEVTQTLGSWCHQLEYRFFCPTSFEMIQSSSQFCWSYDYFEDWIRAYKSKISLVLRLEQPSHSLKEMNTLKGATFEPEEETIRGCHGVNSRVENIIHVPSSRL